MSFTGYGLIAVPISSGITCGLTISIKVLNEIIMQNHNKYKKLHERDQKTIKTFDKLYRKSLQDNLIDENENKSFCKIFTKSVDGTKSFSIL